MYLWHALWLRLVSLFENICIPSFFFFLIDYHWCYFETFNDMGKLHFKV